MQHIAQSQAQKFENGAVASWEYNMDNAGLNVAPITIKGRYPGSGFTSNLISDSIVHVTGGTGILTMRDGIIVELAAGDQVHILTNEAYYFDGDLEVIYCAAPAWTPGQAKHID